MKKKLLVIIVIILIIFFIIGFIVILKNRDVAIASDNTIMFKGVTYQSIDLGDDCYAYPDKKLANVKLSNKSEIQHDIFSLFKNNEIWSIRNDKDKKFIIKINKTKDTVYCKTEALTEFNNRSVKYENIYTDYYVDKVDEVFFSEIDNLYLNNAPKVKLSFSGKYKVLDIIGTDDCVLFKSKGCIINDNNEYLYSNASDEGAVDGESMIVYKIDDKYKEYIDQLFVNESKKG